jgi:predicted membrane channel-forming protein YqfA (hemolysin III family)
MHNETVNVWSHGLGALTYIFIGAIIVLFVPNLELTGLDFVTGNKSSLPVTEYF